MTRTALKDGTIIRVKQKNGEYRSVGRVFGTTFVAFERDETKHLFRGGADTAKDAIVEGTAAWGLDLEVMESLRRDYDVVVVEIPTKRARYRAKMETVLGPKSFVVEFGGHRPQTMLNLEYWAELPVRTTHEPTRNSPE